MTLLFTPNHYGEGNGRQKCDNGNDGSHRDRDVAKLVAFRRDGAVEEHCLLQVIISLGVRSAPQYGASFGNNESTGVSIPDVTSSTIDALSTA